MQVLSVITEQFRRQLRERARKSINHTDIFYIQPTNFLQTQFDHRYKIYYMLDRMPVNINKYEVALVY